MSIESLAGGVALDAWGAADLCQGWSFEALYLYYLATEAASVSLSYSYTIQSVFYRSRLSLSN